MRYHDVMGSFHVLGNCVLYGRVVMKVSALFYKVIAWRMVSIISMLLITWVLTGNLAQSTGLTLIVQAVQTIVHAIFESVWENNRCFKITPHEACRITSKR